MSEKEKQLELFKNFLTDYFPAQICFFCGSCFNLSLVSYYIFKDKKSSDIWICNICKLEFISKQE